ncbi:hypothetical protein ACQPZJ_37960 [Actinoplanes sp. CA-054009]
MLDHLVDHSARFRALLGDLFVLDDNPLAALIGPDRSLGGRIDQHVFNNDDWTAEQLFDELGAIDASDRRFTLLLEGMVSSETIPDEPAQRDLVAAINPPLAGAGLQLRETGAVEGYPVFTVVGTRSHTGRPKNLIFASPVKPDLRLSDAIDNDIEIVSNADEVLVYDRPIGADGLRWRDLQDWWRDTHTLDSEEQAKADLYRRLRHSLPINSPPTAPVRPLPRHPPRQRARPPRPAAGGLAALGSPDRPAARRRRPAASAHGLPAAGPRRRPHRARGRRANPLRSRRPPTQRRTRAP